MKTKHFLLGAIGLLAMASCSNDELVGVNHDGDEIAFNVVTNASSRANTESGGVYCNTNKPKTFYVWAATTDDKQTFINGDKIAYTGSNSMLSQANQSGQSVLKMTVEHNLSTGWANTCLRYWPENRSLNFFASVNATSDDENYQFNWNGGNDAPTIAVNVPTEVTAQKDLLYAVKTEQNKDTNKGVVDLNFRHALSQVVFTAENASQKLYVKVEGVSICNVKSQGTFTYPTANTEENIDGHPSATDTPEDTEIEPKSREQILNPTTPTETPDPSRGTWGSLSDATNYSVSFAAVEIPTKTDQNSAPTSLTNTNYTYTVTKPSLGEGEPTVETKVAEYSELAMLLLPQTSEAWKPAETGNTGTYFLVKCLIYNIAGTTFDSTKDVCVWGTKKETENGDGTKTVTYEAKEVAIPVALNWKQGKKYIYNFIFGRTSGYDPTDPQPDPNPDLVPISFELTVDEFEPVSESIPAQGVLQLLQ